MVNRKTLAINLLESNTQEIIMMEDSPVFLAREILIN